jgi:hypothetical protein
LRGQLIPAAENRFPEHPERLDKSTLTRAVEPEERRLPILKPIGVALERRNEDRSSL